MSYRFLSLIALAYPVLAITAGVRLSAQTVTVVGPAPEYTAEQILNGETPGRKASPAPFPYSFDPAGFAQERVFHVPAAGVHPRVLFAPEDLPGIRKRLKETDSGRQMLEYVRKQLADGLDKRGTWENKLFTRLERGDVAGFEAMYRETDYETNDAVVPGNAIHLNKNAQPATKWNHREPFSVELELKAFVALVDQDEKAGRAVAKVLTGYAEYFEPKIDRAAKGRYGDNYWRAIRPVVDEHPYLSMTYDWDYGYMDPAQRAQVRRVISKITKGKSTLGMDLPPHWRNWNYIGLSMYFCLYSLAIEGEEGYDPRIYKRSVEVVRDYLAYAINPSGMAHEAVGYHTGGLTHITELMIAMANRGDNFFTQSNYRAQFDQWFVQTMQPYGGEWFSDGDLGNFAPGLEPVMTAKYFYPNDAKLDYVYQNLPDVKADDYKHDYFIEAMLIGPADPLRGKDGKLVDYKSGAALGETLTYSDEARGVMIARSAWTSNALYLNFACHPDTTFAGHDHADRGRFVLSGLGRNWAWQDSRPHDTGDTNSVLIDDVGQGYFAPPAKWLGLQRSAIATFAGCDAKYAYDWRWRKSITMWSPDDPRFETSFYRWAKKNTVEVPRANVERDPSPGVKAYYDGYLAGNPMMWDEDSWILREPNNPVEYAFRTAGLVLGTHPYAVIVDDLKKDEAAHLYTWVMQLEPDLAVAEQHAEGGVRDVIVKEQNGDRRLLLRVFTEGGESQPAYVDNHSATVALRGIAANVHTQPRLVIPVKATTLRMKVLLFAYREGESLPVTVWTADHAALSVAWTDQKDSVRFTQATDGSSVASVTRGGTQ